MVSAQNQRDAVSELCCFAAQDQDVAPMSQEICTESGAGRVSHFVRMKFILVYVATVTRRNQKVPFAFKQVALNIHPNERARAAFCCGI